MPVIIMWTNTSIWNHGFATFVACFNIKERLNFVHTLCLRLSYDSDSKLYFHTKQAICHCKERCLLWGRNYIFVCYLPEVLGRRAIFQTVANFSPKRPRFDSMSIHARFMAKWQQDGFLRVLWFVLGSITVLLLRLQI